MVSKMFLLFSKDTWKHFNSIVFCIECSNLSYQIGFDLGVGQKVAESLLLFQAVNNDDS